MPRILRSERLIHKRLAVLEQTLPPAAAGSATALHQARVATRRLRAVLPLMPESKGQHRVGRAVKRLTRTLGSVRELDVALENLVELEAEPGVPRAALARVRRWLLDERTRHQREVENEIAHCDLARLKKRALRANRRRRGTSREVTAQLLDEAAGEARLKGEHLRLAIEHAAGIYLPDRLHEVRIAVKKLRYSLESLAELRGTRPFAGTVKLQHAQDLLGRMHDLERLIARTREVQAQPGAASLRHSAELDRLVRRLEVECREQHAHYISLRIPLLAICERARRLATVGRSRKPNA